jgi:hypothetical protein
MELDVPVVRVPSIRELLESGPARVGFEPFLAALKARAGRGIKPR